MSTWPTHRLNRQQPPTLVNVAWSKVEILDDSAFIVDVATFHTNVDLTATTKHSRPMDTQTRDIDIRADLPRRNKAGPQIQEQKSPRFLDERHVDRLPINHHQQLNQANSKQQDQLCAPTKFIEEQFNEE